MRFSAGSQRDHRHVFGAVAGPPQPPGCLDPIDHRHHEVHQDQRKGPLLRGGGLDHKQGLMPILRRIDTGPKPANHHAGQLEPDPVIFGHKHALCLACAANCGGGHNGLHGFDFGKFQ